jgi:hypothetical protein
MKTRTRLSDLADMHPRLTWAEIATAAAAVLGGSGPIESVAFSVDCHDLPGFGSGPILLDIDCSSVTEAEIARIRRTYESSRLVELAAIAVTGLSLYHGGGHNNRRATNGKRPDCCQ